jgi:5-methylcytosine-specific restriction protein A
MAQKPPSLCLKCKTVKRGPCPKCTNGKRHNWQSDRERGTRQDRGYDNAWLKLRKAKLLADPLCQYCLKKKPEIVTAAAQVHHIVPFRGLNDSLRLEWSNLASVCLRCHGKLTARK